MFIKISLKAHINHLYNYNALVDKTYVNCIYLSHICAVNKLDACKCLLEVQINVALSPSSDNVEIAYTNVLKK